MTKGKALAIPVPGPGRKSLYLPEYADQARKLCLLGATDAELADFFMVTEQTVNNWKNAHPAFFESIRAGKIQADANVADSLYRRATGEHVTMEKVMKNSDGVFEAVRYQSYIPGDPAAAYRWLVNRRRQNWSEQSTVVHSGAVELTTKEQRDAVVKAAELADGNTASSVH